ncbi:hypothetical protein [Azotobacter chroococcum]|uniref:hypothetical protein n=1 Tax=Azotobacter chroococcum TaxID=353 RepID=UPI0010ADBD51|nr:hypothetical protein [Azotobacter chroococcum]TKD30024.1 hypothetical protein FCG41_24420 [Azotobacter chroococcum]
MLMDRPRDDFVTLKNGKRVLITCSWANQRENVVIKARVLIEDSTGFGTIIGEIDGPFSQQEANEVGAVIANKWYDRHRC